MHSQVSRYVVSICDPCIGSGADTVSDALLSHRDGYVPVNYASVLRLWLINIVSHIDPTGISVGASLAVEPQFKFLHLSSGHIRGVCNLFLHMTALFCS